MESFQGTGYCSLDLVEYRESLIGFSDDAAILPANKFQFVKATVWNNFLEVYFLIPACACPIFAKPVRKFLIRDANSAP